MLSVELKSFKIGPQIKILWVFLSDILHGLHFHSFIAIKSYKEKMQKYTQYVHFVFIYKSLFKIYIYWQIFKI